MVRYPVGARNSLFLKMFTLAVVPTHSPIQCAPGAWGWPLSFEVKNDLRVPVISSCRPQGQRFRDPSFVVRVTLYFYSVVCASETCTHNFEFRDFHTASPHSRFYISHVGSPGSVGILTSDTILRFCLMAERPWRKHEVLTELSLGTPKERGNRRRMRR